MDPCQGQRSISMGSGLLLRQKKDGASDTEVAGTELCRQIGISQRPNPPGARNASGTARVSRERIRRPEPEPWTSRHIQSLISLRVDLCPLAHAGSSPPMV